MGPKRQRRIKKKMIKREKRGSSTRGKIGAKRERPLFSWPEGSRRASLGCYVRGDNGSRGPVKKQKKKGESKSNTEGSKVLQ